MNFVREAENRTVSQDIISKDVDVPLANLEDSLQAYVSTFMHYSQVVDLTEAEIQYGVSVVKHVYII